MNSFNPNQGSLRAGCPYKIQNGNYGVYLPKRLLGIETAGRLMIIDLKTNNLRKAQERIDALYLWLKTGLSKDNF